MKRQHKAAAVIDIGSNSVCMHISQWNGKRLLPLDRLEKPLSIGQEVFTSGYLSFDTVRALSSILAGFCSLAREYGIPRVQVVATTALREAVNRAYVLDHLAIQNHLEVHVLEDGEANSLLFDLVKDSGPKAGRVLLVHGGSGTINFALQKGGEIVFTQSMHTGLLKIAEMLRETATYSSHVEHVAEEFLLSYLTRSQRMRHLQQVDAIAFGAGSSRSLFQLLGIPDGKEKAVVARDALLQIHEDCRQLSVDQIAARLRMDPMQAGALYAAITLLAALVRQTGVRKLHLVQIDVADALLNLQLRPGARRAFNESLRADTIACTYELSERYCCDREHAAHVCQLALTLFEQLRKVHGLSRRQSLLLQTACILHECGQYTNNLDTQEASFDLVKDAQIYGLKAQDTLLAANIIAPQSLLGVDRRILPGARLTEEEVLFVAKMHALLHLADALDFSRRQKAILKGVELDGSRLTLLVQVQEDYGLEQWMFRQSAGLFQEVFGLELQMEVERSKLRGSY